MIRHTLMAVTLGLILFFLYLFQYTGAFKAVTLATDERGPYTVIYLEHIGPYHKTVDKIKVVETWAQSKGLKCRLSFGYYFDNPRLTEEGRLKSHGGCLIDPLVEEEARLFETIKKELPADFKTEVLPKKPALVALFDGAASIGPMKVYPRAEEYIQENNLKTQQGVIEIYEIFDQKSMRTTYIWWLISA